MKYIFIAVFMLQKVQASSIIDLEFNNSTKEVVFAQSEEDLNLFFTDKTRLSGTDILCGELIQILKTPSSHIWKMKLAHNMITCIPEQMSLEDLNFLRIFGKRFKDRYLREEYEKYKIIIKESKEALEKPARSFKSNKRRESFLGDSSDDEV